MDNKIDYNTLLDFSAGKYSYSDYLKVKHWFSHVKNDKVTEKQLFNQWKEFAVNSGHEAESMHHIFEKIQYHILLEEKKREKKTYLWHYYRQAAAILLIPVLAFSLWFYLHPKPDAQPVAESWVEINAPDGSRVEFFLPDSSSGWLNSGSKLKYPAVIGENRHVELTGEAWFNVKHKDNFHFTVCVPDMDVKVLGTQFNVTAYPGDAFTDVVLAEGKVEINGKAGVFNYTLSPDEKISFNRETKSLNLNQVDASRYSAWKDGYLIIDNEPLGQVVSRFERWYNADIEIQDVALKNYRFKATFKDEPLEEVLRLIAVTTPIKYSIEKRAVDEKGVYKKKKVTIKLK